MLGECGKGEVVEKRQYKHLLAEVSGWWRSLRGWGMMNAQCPESNEDTASGGSEGTEGDVGAVRRGWLRQRDQCRKGNAEKGGET